MDEAERSARSQVRGSWDTAPEEGARIWDAFEPRGKISIPVYWTIGLTGVVVLLGAWYVVTAARLVDPLFLPPPSSVITSGVHLFLEDGYLTDIWASVRRVLVGFWAAAFLAIPLGALMGTYRPIEALFRPFVGFSLYLPASAFIPLLILWIGIDEAEKSSVIFLGAIFPLILLVEQAVVGLPQEFLDTSYTLGASRVQVIWQVLLPGAFPQIVDSLRITFGWAWTYIIVAELVASENGIGFQILSSQRMVRIGPIIFGILTLGVIGLVSDLCFRLAHRVLFPWSRGESK